MNLYEITNGLVGESYVRIYAWATNEERALELVANVLTKGSSPLEVEYLFSADTPEFVTIPSDSGFEFDGKEGRKTKESFDNGPEYEQAKIDRMVEFVNDVIEQGEERIAFGLWQEFFESHSNPFVVQEYWGEDLQCYFCDGEPDHKPDCIYLRAKALIEE